MITPVYRSQWGAGATRRINDCGPSCVSMYLMAIGDFTPIDQLRTNDSTGLTTADDLVRIFAEHGVRAHVEKLNGLDEVKPNSILLVNYDPLRKYAQDINFRGWHWLIDLYRDGDYVVTHDPDYGVRGLPASEGAFKRYPVQAMRSAFRPYSSRDLCTAVVVDGVIEVKDSGMSVAMYVNIPGGLNVRKKPAGTIVSSLAHGNRVMALDYKKDALLGTTNYTWRAIALPDDTLAYVAEQHLSLTPP